MAYKKGYPYKTYPANIPADWDWVWHVGAMGGRFDGAYDPYLEDDLIEWELEQYMPRKYKITAEINIFGLKFPITGIAEALDE